MNFCFCRRNAMAMALMCALATQTHAGQIDEVLGKKLETVSVVEKVPVIIYMKDQVDLDQMEIILKQMTPAGTRVPVDMRYRTIITALQSISASTQPVIVERMATLTAAGSLSDIQRFWIRNIIVAGATPQTIREIASWPEVDVVYLDGILQRDIPVSVSSAGSSPESAENGLKAIKADRLWALGYVGQGRLVMNIDTGVHGPNVGLNSRWRGNQPGIHSGWAWFDPETGSPTPTDGDASTPQHGTHTMGIMCGLYTATNETLGVAPGAQWIAARTINSSPHTSRSIAAFQWAANPDSNIATMSDVPDAISNSWFDPDVASTQCTPNAGGYGPVIDAVEALGTAVVFSAGNNGPGPSTVTPPKNRIATAANIFTVGALDGNSASFPIASFSSRGPSVCAGPDSLRVKPEVSAPGVNVRSTSGTNGFLTISGTSMASPHVAGAIALLRSVAPFMTGTELKYILMNTAADLGTSGDDNDYGHGIIDVWAAYQQLPLSRGFVKGTVTSGGNPLSGVTVDFTDSVLQQSGTSNAGGLYLANASIDTHFTTAHYTIRARKFGYITHTDTITIAVDDTVTRNIAMTPAAGGTLAIHAHRSDASGIRANVHVIFAGTEVINDFTDSTTGNFSAPLPVGSYDVIVDPPSPYGTRTFNGTVISAGTTTNVDALVRPVVEPSPTAVRDTLVVGQNHAKTLTLTNTTGDPVPFRISDDNVLLKMSKPAVQEPIVRQREMFLPKNYVDRGTGGDQTSGAGGPDGFGYRWIDSDEPGGPAYSWVDIKAVGTQITTWSSGTGDDGFFTIPTFPGGFSFPFYGNTFTGIHIGTNGNVQFSAAGSTQYINDAIPTATVPNNAIYPFWDDLDVSTAGAGTIWYYYDAANSQFIVQWDTVSHYTGGGVQGRYTFEVILRPSGEIVCQYRSMLTTVNSSTIGVEDAAGTVGLPVVFNGAYMHDNLALRFYLPDAGWISENPTIGTLAPNSSSNITVTFDAAGLNSGTTYSANLIVDATHPDVSGSLLVPASLKVQLADSAVLILNKTTVTFPTTQINTTRQDTVTAHNGGVLPLNISSITRTNTDYAVTPASAVVAPGDSVRIFISYTPTAVGSDTGRVIILSNSQGTPRSDVILNGTCIAAPAIGVAPSAVADTLQVGQSHSKSFTITNTATPPANFLFVSLTESVPWLAVSPSADTLAPSEGGSFACQFNATGLAVGTYTTNVTIASNDPANPSTNVGITLRVVGAPVITVRPDSLVKAVLSGGSATDTVVIKNTGLSTLTWTMTDIPTTANRTQPNIHHGPELPKGSDDGLSSGPITDDQGGPDAFGYRWIDSDEPGGPVFNWIDISSTGTALDSSSAWVPTGTFRGGDEGYFTITLPFPFSYYGVSYTTMNIGTNGNLMFQLPTGNVFTNAAFPTAGDPIDNHMGAFWDDLEVRGPGKVYYGMSGTNFVVQYNQVCRFNSSVPNYTFEFILTPGGAWYYQYLTMGITGGTIIQATIGMENAGATIGLGVVHNAAYIHDNLAILIASDLTWLSETPTSGSLNPGDSVKVVVAFNGTGLPDGLYRGSLSITSNDPATPTKLVPVKFTVGTLGVSDINPGVPATFELSQNYPNPFNPTTRIEFALPTASSIRLSVYNILGQEVVTLASEQRPAGYHSIEWNGRDASGRTLSSGIYFYKLEATATSGSTSFVTLRKMILLK